jgi:AraC-like DNA-binding protein
MRSRLDRITDWEKRAEKANYRVFLLAEECGVTERQLRRYIHAKFGSSPNLWMMKGRIQKGPDLLQQGSLAKEVAAVLGFKCYTHFHRQFRRYFKTNPTSFRSSISKKSGLDM